jgi:hypothetical protein
MKGTVTRRCLGLGSSLKVSQWMFWFALFCVISCSMFLAVQGLQVAKTFWGYNCSVLDSNFAFLSYFWPDCFCEIEYSCLENGWFFDEIVVCWAVRLKLCHLSTSDPSFWDLFRWQDCSLGRSTPARLLNTECR